MCEEKGLTIDMPAYEQAKKEAKELSQGKVGGEEDGLGLDVHGVAELQDKGVGVTEDGGKYGYGVEGGEYGELLAKYVSAIFSN